MLEDIRPHRGVAVGPIYASESPEPDGQYSFDLSQPAELLEYNFDTSSSSLVSSPPSYDSGPSTPSNHTSPSYSIVADRHLIRHYKQLVHKLEGNRRDLCCTLHSALIFDFPFHLLF